jgi:predicted CoA-binding protein
MEGEMRRVLESAHTIAVVGISDKPDRDSHSVSAYMQSAGYRIVPVNPLVAMVLGERAYPSLAAIPPEVRVDIVDIFRRSDQVPPVVDEAVARGVGAIWMQLGVESPDAASTARAAGIPVFQNSCIRVAHQHLRIPRRVRAATSP